jgi:hypothetical protein
MQGACGHLSTHLPQFKTHEFDYEVKVTTAAADRGQTATCVAPHVSVSTETLDSTAAAMVGSSRPSTASPTAAASAGEGSDAPGAPAAPEGATAAAAKDAAHRMKCAPFPSPFDWYHTRTQATSMPARLSCSSGATACCSSTSAGVSLVVAGCLQPRTDAGSVAEHASHLCN